MKKPVVFILAVSCGLIGLVSSCAQKSTAPEGNTWAVSMQGLAAEVADLLPFVYSKQNFFDVKNRDVIQAKLKKFSQSTHKISPQMGQQFFGEDPLVNYSLENMSDDLKRAEEAFRLGQLEYSRAVTKTVVNHCFRCHSVVSAGATAKWELKNIENLPISSLERVDLLVASKRYEEATKNLETLLSDTDYLKHYPFDFEAALRKYLALMVRINQQPARSLERMDVILAKNEMPYYITEQVQAWRQSLRSWIKESKKKNTSLIAQAQERIKRGKGMQKYAKDHAGDIEYLRATSLLHEYLKSKGLAPKDLAQAYFSLGEAYEILDELGYWNLHEVYYESCILRSPKSQVARSCFGRLEASVYLGYSGSSGVHLPENERERLNRLKSLLR